MKILVKSLLVASLLGLSIPSFALEASSIEHHTNISDLSKKKQRQSSLVKLASIMQGHNTYEADTGNVDLILQTTHQNSLNQKKLPENLVAVR